MGWDISLQSIDLGGWGGGWGSRYECDTVEGGRKDGGKEDGSIGRQEDGEGIWLWGQQAVVRIRLGRRDGMQTLRKGIKECLFLLRTDCKWSPKLIYD